MPHLQSRRERHRRLIRFPHDSEPFITYTITSEGASKGYFRLVEDAAGCWVTWAEVEALLALSEPEPQKEPQDWKLLYERAEDMLLRVEWVRQSAGNKYACPFCKCIADRDDGPGHADDCEWSALVVGRHTSLPVVEPRAQEEK